MKKFIVLFLVIILCSFSFITFVNAEGLNTQAKSYILMDAASGDVLVEKDADKQMDCASIVKVMSLLIICDAVDSGRLSLTDTVSISKNAASMGGTQVFLDANTTHKVEDLLKAVAICSANDATVALAEKVAGSEESFVEMMNKESSVLGLGAHFINSTGLAVSGQTMSAKDAAEVVRQLIKYDYLLKWASIWLDTYKHPGGRETEMSNSNRLVRYYSGCDGISTGSSNEAGYCLAATVKRTGGRFIYVSFGSPNSSARFDDAAKAFDYAYAGFTAKTIVKQGQLLGKNLQVAGGTTPYVDVYAANDFSALIEKGKESTLEKELVLLEDVSAPLNEGDVIGYLRIMLDGEEIGRVDAVVNQNIDVLSFSNALKRIITWWLFA